MSAACRSTLPQSEVSTAWRASMNLTASSVSLLSSSRSSAGAWCPPLSRAAVPASRRSRASSSGRLTWSPMGNSECRVLDSRFRISPKLALCLSIAAMESSTRRPVACRPSRRVGRGRVELHGLCEQGGSGVDITAVKALSRLPSRRGPLLTDRQRLRPSSSFPIGPSKESSGIDHGNSHSGGDEAGFLDYLETAPMLGREYLGTGRFSHGSTDPRESNRVQNLLPLFGGE